MKQNQIALVVGIIGFVILAGLFLRFNSNSGTSQDQTTQQNTPNSQQAEIDALKKTVEDLKNSKTNTTSTIKNTDSNSITTTKQKSLADIIAQWRKSTAYVECYWVNPSTRQVYLKQSGSGLLVMLGTNDMPTVITNRHVVTDSQYGTASECDAVFPGDKYAFYSINNLYRPAYTDYTVPSNPLSIPADPTNGQINLDNTKDVAFLSDFKKNDVDLVPPTISLENRAVSGNFPCASDPSIGDPIVILGYPSYGSGAGTITSVFSHLEITATEGIVSGNDSGYYTTSAKIEHGNSGGLAIDETNNCYLGIPTASYTGEIESLGRILPASYIFKY